MQLEIAGHEFFSPDGKYVWYDLQISKDEDFSPGGKWIVFRGNMFGPEYVFAVEVAKAR